MPRLYHRQPLQLKTPNADSIKNYYFNHYTWKGINEDKNYLTVDQETFADAKNVYVDDNGILTSRPGLIQSKDVSFYVHNFWSFSNIVVYLIDSNNSKNLLIVDGDTEVILPIVIDNVVIKEMDNKLIIFSDFGNEYIKYYDKSDKTVKSADDILYIPTLEAYSELENQKTETRNILTSKNFKTFLYNPETGLSPDIYTYPSISYDIETPISKNTIEVDTQYSSLSERLVDYAFLLGVGKLIVSSAGQLLYIDESNKQVRYSPDGLTFTKIYNWNFVSLQTAFFNFGSDETGYISTISLNTGSGGQTYRLDVNGDIIYSSARLEKPFMGPYLGSSAVQQWSDRYYYDGNQFLIMAQSNSTYYFRYNISAKVITGLSLYDSASDLRLYFLSANDTSCYLRIIESTGGFNSISSEFSSTNLNATGKMIGYTTNKIVFFNDSTKSLQVYYIDNSEYYPSQESTIYTLNIDSSSDTAWSVSDDKIIFTHCYVNNEYWECGVYEYNGSLYPIILPDYTGNILSIGIGSKIFITKQKDSDTNVPLYRSGLNRVIELKGVVSGEQQDIASKFITTTTLNESYFSVDNYLYITEYREEDGKFKLYIPEKSKQQFNSNILALAPISDNLVAIFTENDVWYVQHSDSGYLYYKSKLELALKKSPEVVTDRSGVTTLLCDRNGLLGLSYQSFMATSEQALTYLSSPVSRRFESGEINRITVYKDYIFCYDGKTSDVYVLDVRTSSWWYLDFNTPVDKISVFMNDVWDYELAILSDGKVYKFNNDKTKYYDDIDGKLVKIDWFIKSQKLHLNAVNNYKHITNITFNSVEGSELTVRVNLSINNYRKYVDEGKPENFEYEVDIIRTFVKRLNYAKINEFEYTLKADDDASIQSPLSLSNISIKYKIGSEVR